MKQKTIKYRDLIEKLLPFADEEISIITQHEFCPYDLMDADNETGYFEDSVKFYQNSEDSTDLITTIEQKYDSITCEIVEI